VLEPSGGHDKENPVFMLLKKYGIMKIHMAALLIMGCIPLSARTISPAVLLEAGKNEYPLGTHVDYLEDRDERFLIGDITAGGNELPIMHSTKENINLGFSSSAWWFRFTVKNLDHDNGRWLLELGYPHHDYVEFYVPNGKGGYSLKIAGDQRPFVMREVQNRNFLFNLDIPRNRSMTLYMRIKTESSVQVPLRLWEPVRFAEMVNSEQYGLGLYYGIMLVMILYNLFLFFGIREKTYILYVAYITVLTLAQMSLNGLAFEYLWPNWPWWTNKSVLLSLFGSIFFLTLFGRAYLDSRTHVPRLDKLMIALAAASFLGMVMSFTAPYSVGVKFVAILASLLIIASPIAAFFCWRKKVPSAQYYLIAFMFLLFGVMCIGMRNLGLPPTGFITTYSIQIGSALQAVLLSLGLADRFNILNKEKLLARKEMLVSHLTEKDRIKDEMNKDLENAHQNTKIDMMMAGNIQKTLFPMDPPRTDEWDTAFLFHPMAGVSGDFYDFYQQEGQLHGVVLLDVSGHGVASGLITMIARTVFHRLFYKMRKQNLNDVIVSADQTLIAEIGRIDNYITGIMLRFEGDMVEYVNAAHPHMYLRRGRSLNVHTINKKAGDFRGHLLGLEVMDKTYERLRFRMERNDTLLLYTDCLSEAYSAAHDEQYGETRIIDALGNAPAGTASEILDHIMEDFFTFTGDRSLNDDLTVILIQRKI
jgi:serine phosphatase RsbU (regulator of sigma subunit)